MRRISLINCHSVELRISGPSSRPLWTILISARSPHLFNRYTQTSSQQQFPHVVHRFANTNTSRQILPVMGLWLDWWPAVNHGFCSDPPPSYNWSTPSSTFTAQWYRLVNPPLAGLILQQANSEGREDSILQLNPSSSCFYFTDFCFQSKIISFFVNCYSGLLFSSSVDLAPPLCYK